VRLEWDEHDEAFRSELRAFLDKHTPPESLATGFELQDASNDRELVPQWMREWQATLFDSGWMVPGYPPELGGRSCTTLQTLIYLETLANRRISRSAHFPGYAVVAPGLLEFGNDEQKALAPAAIRGDTIWCIGMSEPNAGSDLAALQTRAELQGDHFIVNGQKVWTSFATIAQKCLCYVRTDATLPKHKGISALIVDLDTPGIDVRPLRHLNGDAGFAEVFFTDVVVPHENLVGPLNGGWAITQGSLAHERGGLWIESIARFEQTISALVDLARRTGRDTDPVIRRKIASIYEVASSLRSLGYKGFASFAQGTSASEHSYMRVATSEATKAAFELGMEISGPLASVSDAELGLESGRYVDGFFLALASTIAGGSSEIQRNIIAQRVLGLPRR
jgi:alkylation response protein AidB-like acyl-CoA dehydrogenase